MEVFVDAERSEVVRPHGHLVEAAIAAGDEAPRAA